MLTCQKVGSICNIDLPNGRSHLPLPMHVCVSFGSTGAVNTAGEAPPRPLPLPRSLATATAAAFFFHLYPVVSHSSSPQNGLRFPLQFVANLHGTETIVCRNDSHPTQPGTTSKRRWSHMVDEKTCCGSGATRMPNTLHLKHLGVEDCVGSKYHGP